MSTLIEIPMAKTIFFDVLFRASFLSDRWIYTPEKKYFHLRKWATVDDIILGFYFSLRRQKVKSDDTEGKKGN